MHYYSFTVKITLKYLKIALFCVLIGRSFQYLYWDAPFRAFFWDQNLLEPIVKLFGYSWNDYATSRSVNTFIEYLIRLNGVIFLCTGLPLLMPNILEKKWYRRLLFFSGILLVLLAFLQTKDKFYHFAMFFEHAIQFSLPFLILSVYKIGISHKRIILFFKIIIAFTFLCHGLYAIGLYPVPANFITMTIHILPLDEPQAKVFLQVAAILDFVIALGVFIPKIAKPILLYATFWGFTTALARIVDGLLYDVSVAIVFQYLYLTVYRLSHGIVPLALYYILKKVEKH